MLETRYCDSCASRWVQEGQVCGNCGHYQERRPKEWEKPTSMNEVSEGIFFLLPFLIAAASSFYVWSHTQNMLLGALAAVIAWYVAGSRLGRAILKILVLCAGLWLMWFILEFSKTFR